MDVRREVNRGSTLSMVGATSLEPHSATYETGFLPVSKLAAPSPSPFLRGTQMVSALKALSKIAK